MEHLSSTLSGIAVTICISLFVYIWNSNRDITLLKEAAKKFPELEKDVKDLSNLKEKVNILYGFWEKEVYSALSIVHKPHVEAKELDDLLDKFKLYMSKLTTHSLKDDELLRFIQLLDEIKENNEASSGDRLAAARILNYIEMKAKMMQLGI